MLRNYITDADLRTHYPNIAKQIWTAQSNYAPQIAESFDHLQNDLYNKGINPRLCMIPLDLRYATSDQPGGVPKVMSESASAQGSAYPGNNERRLVLSVIANTGVNSIKMQGSNDPGGTPVASTWSDIADAVISLSGSGSTGTRTVQFADQFKWYRYVSTIDASGSCVYSASLVEVIFDHAIVMGAFRLIFGDMTIEKDDIWDRRKADADLEYANLLDQIKFGYDVNDNGLLAPDETERTGQVTFLR